MDHVLLALRAHADIAKLEFEDGLVRGLAADRISSETGVHRIEVDLPQELPPAHSGLQLSLIHISEPTRPY